MVHSYSTFLSALLREERECDGKDHHADDGCDEDEGQASLGIILEGVPAGRNHHGVGRHTDGCCVSAGAADDTSHQDGARVGPHALCDAQADGNHQGGGCGVGHEVGHDAAEQENHQSQDVGRGILAQSTNDDVRNLCACPGLYKDDVVSKPHFAVSCQHYSFAVNAFVDVIREFDAYQYDFTIREEQTHEIIEDVTNLKSELGVIYLSSKNTEVLSKMLKRNELEFTELFTATPHVFICDSHPLASKKSITMDDLQDYPYLTYEQGEYNSQYFSEEFVSTLDSRKNIRVRDRATLFNLIIGLNGYTVCSGVISAELNGRNIISKPLDVEEYMRIGIISRKGVVLSRYAREYIEALKAHCM